MTQACYNWKSANIGSDRIDIHPKDPLYKNGKYYIGVMPYRTGINTFFIKLILIDASKITASLFPILRSGGARLQFCEPIKDPKKLVKKHLINKSLIEPI